MYEEKLRELSQITDGGLSLLYPKVCKALGRLKAFEPITEPYYLAFSGGKDSCVCKALCDMAGVKYDAVYRVTSVDPPELVRFIKNVHPDVQREVPRDKYGRPVTMWNLIVRKSMMPTRLVRYCCDKLKEGGGRGRVVITGARWAESVRRKKNSDTVIIRRITERQEAKLTQQYDIEVNENRSIMLNNDNDESRALVEQCYRKHKTTVNPIIDWEDEDVWNFIRFFEIPYCSLYDEGWTRLGCIGCPMAGTRGREEEFERWPKYKQMYINSMQRLMDKLASKGRYPLGIHGLTLQDYWDFWMQYKTKDELIQKYSAAGLEEGE